MRHASSPSVTILVLNWNGKHLLDACLTPLMQQTYTTYDVMLIDNASHDGSVAFVREQFPEVEIVQNSRNLGFAGANNVGLRLAQARSADYAILLNNDVVVPLNWLADFVVEMEQIPDLGVAGCKLLFPDGTIQHLGGRVQFPKVISEHPYQFQPDQNQVAQIQDADYVTGAAFAISRRALETVGVLDELFSPIYFEEVDYCYRTRAAGLRIVLLPSVSAIHDESSTMNLTGNRARMFYMNRLRFAVRHVPIEAFESGFVAAELGRLAAADSAEIILMRELCLQAVLELPHTIDPARPIEALVTLQRGLLKLRDGLASPVGTDLQQADPQVWQFTSNVPVLGRLISTVRSAWFSMGAKWPLKAALDEQRALNEQLIAANQTMAERQKGIENVLGQLSAEVARLQQARYEVKREA